MATDDTLFVLGPLGNEPPASGGATASDINDRPTLEFAASGVTTAVFSLVLPRQYAGDGLRVEIEWTSAGAYEGWGTIAGDTGGLFSGAGCSPPAFTGHTPRFTDDYVLYWSYTIDGDNGILSFYSDAAKTQLVSQGSVDWDVGGTFSCAAINGSDIVGTAFVAASIAADTDAGNTYTHNYRVCWRAEVERLDRQGIDLTGDSFDSPVVGYGAANNQSHVAGSALILLAAGDLDGLLPGEMFRLRISRNGDDAGDTLAAVAQLLAVSVLEG